MMNRFFSTKRRDRSECPHRGGGGEGWGRRNLEKYKKETEGGEKVYIKDGGRKNSLFSGFVQS